jgi:hypothetical protein
LISFSRSSHMRKTKLWRSHRRQRRRG